MFNLRRRPHRDIIASLYPIDKQIFPALVSASWLRTSQVVDNVSDTLIESRY